MGYSVVREKARQEKLAACLAPGRAAVSAFHALHSLRVSKFDCVTFYAQRRIFPKPALR